MSTLISYIANSVTLQWWDRVAPIY